MTQKSTPDLHELVNADRELTDDERSRLRAASQAGWEDIGKFLASRARAAYTADSDDFAECVFQHMDEDQRVIMVAADLYNCPECGRLLKDRKNPVASSILLERGRLREAWLRVEQARDSETAEQALVQFKKALGL